ncbi:MAG: S49 family peptidase [Novosphingobium sp.]|uniref:S49 family peptidase n=1 Tax=Novosphingobium sp. TaxID=1874826 RepID=UPI002736119E|nr:S49 family peptidase [Novosphingobium sp.]MDP3550617.1 S49 family peptidase [Novosphingobium sp.]
MTRLAVAGTLFAMHPAYLDAWLKQNTLEAIMPTSVQQLVAAFGRGPAEAANPDPIREGATAIVPIRGMIGPVGMGARTETNVLAERIRSLAADPKIGAIVLDIHSPGGYVFGTQEAGDAIYEARASKPVVAVANTYAYSAAHWLATQASAFFATPSGEVGSVGVRSGHVDQSGLEEKLGLKTTLIASHPDKIAGHSYGPLADEDRAWLQALVDEYNGNFVAAIARGRGISVAQVANIHGTGKTFSATKAAANGTIDGVMTLRDVVAKYSSSRARLSLMKRQAAVAEAMAGI